MCESSWRSIETAPKDGTIFLGTGFDFGCVGNTRHFVVAHWSLERMRFEPDDMGDYELTHLTHWQPLPAPPKD